MVGVEGCDPGLTGLSPNSDTASFEEAGGVGRVGFSLSGTGELQWVRVEVVAWMDGAGREAGSTGLCGAVWGGHGPRES